MQIIPAIDLINGRCVRLSQGDYQRVTEYKENPEDVAKRFEDVGVKRLHLVDLDGAKAGACKNLKTLEKIASNCNLQIDFSGGLSNQNLVEDAFNAGATYIAVGSLAVKKPDILAQWVDNYGDKILLAADCKDEKIATAGWIEESTQEILPFLQSWVDKGIAQGFVTDIAKDGMLQGPSTSLYTKIRKEVPNFNLIASGGISKMQDILTLLDINLAGVIVGKAIYEGKISLLEIEKYQMQYAG